MDIRSHPATPGEIFDAHGLFTYPHLIPGTTTPLDLYIGGFGYIFGSDPGATFGGFVSSLISDAEHPDGSTQMNWTGFADPVLDRLIEAAASTYDQAERARLYRQAQQELAAQLPHLFLWVAPTSLDAARAAVATADGPLDMTVQNWSWQPERLVVAEGGQ
jgi:ABC-type transport system substrate-binding protein